MLILHTSNGPRGCGGAAFAASVRAEPGPSRDADSHAELVRQRRGTRNRQALEKSHGVCVCVCVRVPT